MTETNAAQRHDETPPRSRLDIWLRRVWGVAWFFFFLYFVIDPGVIYKIVLATAIGALLAVDIATGRWRQARRSWPPNESGIQYWRKRRERNNPR